MSRKCFSMFLLTALLILTLSLPASANPNYAGETDKPCETCHNSDNSLNATGKMFKDNNFSFEPATTAKKAAPAKNAIKTSPPIKKEGKVILIGIILLIIAVGFTGFHFWQRKGK